LKKSSSRSIITPARGRQQSNTFGVGHKPTYRTWTNFLPMSPVSKRINSSRTSDDVDVTLIKSIDLAAPGA
jgi:hypothetical protein